MSINEITERAAQAKLAQPNDGGNTLSVEKIQAALKQAMGGELTDEQLAAVTGGIESFCWSPGDREDTPECIAFLRDLNAIYPGWNFTSMAMVNAKFGVNANK